MDLWIVAAAAGAGYLAKYWQNVLREREGLSGFVSQSSFSDNLESSSLIQQIHGKMSPIRKLLPREMAEQSSTLIGYRDDLDGNFGENSTQDGCIDVGKDEDGSLLSLPIFPPEYGKYDKFEEYRSGYKLDSDVGDLGASHGSRRGKKTLRSKCLNLQYIKPPSSLDSCLVAQMHRERAEVEEYLLSPLVSPCTPTLRPFLVTDGRRVIRRASGDFRDGPLKEVHQKANDGVLGVPPLPQIGAANYSKEKLEKVQSRLGKSSLTCSSMQSDSRGGSSSGQFFFCLGISIGIMSTVITNKLEVEKLKENLKQSENLVEDLQEELEMKDSLTVKELVCDDDSQDTQENLSSDKKLKMFSNLVNSNVVVKCADEESVTVKEVESMTNIEAELEAELERLELSMKGSKLHGILSDSIEFDLEVDEDIIAELVHGELKADISQQKSSSELTHDRQSSSTSTPNSAKQGVSPRELSMRLHEVIQSRLQVRIMELEAELAKTQKRVQDLESERVISWRDVSNSESSSTMGSPIDRSPVVRPLFMNLSADALDAYNEAYEGLNSLKGSQNEASQLPVISPQDILLSTNQGMSDGQNDVQDCTRTSLLMAGKELLPNGQKKIPSSEGSPNLYEDIDDNEDDDDLLLIKQIVEKARQGSPAVLRAQRAMVYSDF